MVDTYKTYWGLHCVRWSVIYNWQLQVCLIHKSPCFYHIHADIMAWQKSPIIKKRNADVLLCFVWIGTPKAQEMKVQYCRERLPTKYSQASHPTRLQSAAQKQVSRYKTRPWMNLTDCVTPTTCTAYYKMKRRPWLPYVYFTVHCPYIKYVIRTKLTSIILHDSLRKLYPGMCIQSL